MFSSADRYDAIPFRQVQILRFAPGRDDAGIGDYDVQPAMAPHQRAHGHCDRSLLGDIAQNCFEAGRQGGARGGRGEVEEASDRAGVRKPLGYGESKPAQSARDQGDFTVEERLANFTVLPAGARAACEPSPISVHKFAMQRNGCLGAGHLSVAETTLTPFDAGPNDASAPELPGAVIAIQFEGERIYARPGESLAGALVAHGVTAFRATRLGAARGLFCGMGVCQDCLVEVDGRPNQRACMTRVDRSLIVRREAPARPLAPIASGAPPISVDDIQTRSPDLLVIGVSGYLPLR